MCQDAIVVAEQPVRPHHAVVETMMAQLLHANPGLQTTTGVQRSAEATASVSAAS